MGIERFHLTGACVEYVYDGTIGVADADEDGLFRVVGPCGLVSFEKVREEAIGQTLCSFPRDRGLALRWLW